MTDKITLSNLANLQNENTTVSTVNNNNATVVSAFNNTLSRDGTSPNQMSATLDMNSQRIINLPTAISTTEPVSLAQMNAALVANGNTNTGLTGVTVSAAMQPVVAASTLTSARALLGVGSSSFANVRNFGAVANGSTDDSSAIQQAINSVISAGGGIVYFPAGNYYIATGLIVNPSSSIVTVTLLGEGMNCSFIQCGTANINLISIDNGRHEIREIMLQGPNRTNSTNVDKNTIWLKSNCVEAKVERCYIIGGFYGIRIDGVDCIISDTTLNGIYGPAMVRIISIATWLRRCKIDQSPPGASPSFPASFSAWQASHSYSVGNIVTLNSWYIQCVVSGASGSSSPSLATTYNTAFTDSSVQWMLVCPTNFGALQIDSGASETHITQCDFSGFFPSGCIAIQNTLGGTAPFLTTITDCVLSGALNNSLNCVAGSSLMLSGNEIFGSLASGNSAVALQNSWTGDATIVNNHILGPGSVGVFIGAGTNTNIVGNNVFNFTGAGGILAAAVTNFNISGNCTGSSTKWGTNTTGILISGASNHYNITNNIVFGAGTGVTDSGSGVNKTVSGNN